MDPRYPVGKFAMPTGITPALRQTAIEEIACTPVKVRSAVAGLTASQLETPYREGGWTSFDENAPAYTADQIAAERTRHVGSCV